MLDLVTPGFCAWGHLIDVVGVAATVFPMVAMFAAVHTVFFLPQFPFYLFSTDPCSKNFATTFSTVDGTRVLLVGYSTLNCRILFHLYDCHFLDTTAQLTPSAHL